MAAIGITEQQVFAAVDALKARGERPTIRAVRAELGTGSMGTIQRIMSQSRSDDGAGVGAVAGDDEPPELSREVLRALSREVQRAADDAAAALRERLQTAEIDRAALAVEVDRLLSELADAVAARDTAQRDLAVTRATLEGVQSRLSDAHAMLDRVQVAQKPAPKKSTAPARKKPVDKQ